MQLKVDRGVSFDVTRARPNFLDAPLRFARGYRRDFRPVRALKRDVILELSFVGDVRCGIDAGEGAEVVDEMRLIEVAARQCNLRPVDAAIGACRAEDVAQNLLETLHATEQLRRQADMLRKQLNEMAIAESDLIGGQIGRAHV